ncbi:sarcosine oxidase subunit alpha, partial [Bacillus cereus]|nr:sarcosine oxidase subunit alpha [Bacillus cereus]
AQGTVAGLSIAKYASKKRDIVDQQLYHAIQNVHSVRQKAAIQFNPMVDIGRRKMNDLWHKFQTNDKDFYKQQEII